MPTKSAANGSIRNLMKRYSLITRLPSARAAMTAAFVDATDSRYGFRSKDLRRLGGSELSRIHESTNADHEWSSKLPPNGDRATTDFPPNGGRIVLRLYWDVAPLACENFATLCTNGGNSLDVVDGACGGGDDNNNKRPRPAPVGESGKGLTYRDSPIHRVGGDFVFGNGSGGESIYGGKKFKDERAGLGLRHDRAGLLSMGNGGKNSNTSQFFVTLDAAPQCDGRHVIFGEVISGMEVLRYVEGFASSMGGAASPPCPSEYRIAALSSP
ncbi:hypothetical protein ACHAW5_005796 [Stephanodiscus triporus]|uniref:Peptidyl-prolyl cis-trans isomerase n=1 Tax=Stephanodiscus triporus TaxID=2934178 RepID=A0ABD3PUJ4_9STRA